MRHTGLGRDWVAGKDWGHEISKMLNKFIFEKSIKEGKMPEDITKDIARDINEDSIAINILEDYIKSIDDYISKLEIEVKNCEIIEEKNITKDISKSVGIEKATAISQINALRYISGTVNKSINKLGKKLEDSKE